MFALAFFQSNIYRYVCTRGCTDEVKTGGETHEIDQLYATGGGTSGQRYVIDPPQGLYYNNSYDDAGVGISVGTNGVSIYEHNYGYMPAVLIWEGTITDWTHIALVYENKIPRLYINGNLVGTGTASPKTHVYPGTLLGSGVFGTMNGWIDEARIWSTVRTQQQIQDNMNKSVATPQSNLEAYWPIQTGETTNLQDISGNNHTVVLPPGNNYGSYTNDGSSTAPLSGDYYYRYGFNGKENDNEVKGTGNQLDFGARIYDSRIARFFSRDPSHHLNISVSTYSFAGNSPIANIDYNGLFKISPFFVSRYPNLTKVLAYVMPAFINDENKMQSWMAEVGISDKNVGKKLWTEMLTYGTGPYVTLTRMASELNDPFNNKLAQNFFEDLNTKKGSYGGDWSDNYPENLAVGFNFASDLESALKNGDAFDIGFRIFSAMIICVHEGGHWARYRAGLVNRGDINNEDGARSEIGFFGRKFSYLSEQKKGFNNKIALDEYKKLHYASCAISKNFISDIVTNFRSKSVPLGQKGDPTLKDNSDDENSSSSKRGVVYTPDYKPATAGGSYQ